MRNGEIGHIPDCGTVQRQHFHHERHRPVRGGKAHRIGGAIELTGLGGTVRRQQQARHVGAQPDRDGFSRRRRLGQRQRVRAGNAAANQPGRTLNLRHDDRGDGGVDHLHLDIADRQPIEGGIVALHRVADDDGLACFGDGLIRRAHSDGRNAEPGPRAGRRGRIEDQGQRLGEIDAVRGNLDRPSTQIQIFGRRQGGGNRQIDQGRRGRRDGREFQCVGVDGAGAGAALDHPRGAAAFGDGDHPALPIGNRGGQARRGNAVERWVGAAHRMADRAWLAVHGLRDDGAGDVAGGVEPIVALPADQGGDDALGGAENVEAVVSGQSVHLQTLDVGVVHGQPGTEHRCLGDGERIVAIRRQDCRAVDTLAAIDPDRRVDGDLPGRPSAEEGADGETIIAAAARQEQRRIVGVGEEDIVPLPAQHRGGKADAAAQSAGGGRRSRDFIGGLDPIDGGARGAKHLPDLEQIGAGATIQHGQRAVVIDIDTVVAGRGVDPQQFDGGVVVDPLIGFREPAAGRLQHRDEAGSQQDSIGQAGAVEDQFIRTPSRSAAVAAGPAVMHGDDGIGGARRVDGDLIGPRLTVDVDGIAQMRRFQPGHETAGCPRLVAVFVRQIAAVQRDDRHVVAPVAAPDIHLAEDRHPGRTWIQADTIVAKTTKNICLACLDRPGQRDPIARVLAVNDDGRCTRRHRPLERNPERAELFGVPTGRSPRIGRHQHAGGRNRDLVLIPLALDPDLRRLHRAGDRGRTTAQRIGIGLIRRRGVPRPIPLIVHLEVRKCSRLHQRSGADDQVVPRQQADRQTGLYRHLLSGRVLTVDDDAVQASPDHRTGAQPIVDRDDADRGAGQDALGHRDRPGRGHRDPAPRDDAVRPVGHCPADGQCADIVDPDRTGDGLYLQLLHLGGDAIVGGPNAPTGHQHRAAALDIDIAGLGPIADVAAQVGNERGCLGPGADRAQLQVRCRFVDVDVEQAAGGRQCTEPGILAFDVQRVVGSSDPARDRVQADAASDDVGPRQTRVRRGIEDGARRPQEHVGVCRHDVIDVQVASPLRNPDIAECVRGDGDLGVEVQVSARSRARTANPTGGGGQKDVARLDLGEVVVEGFQDRTGRGQDNIALRRKHRFHAQILRRPETRGGDMHIVPRPCGQ